MKIALIGCGYWGRIVAKALIRSKCLFSVYDVRIKAAKEIAEKYNVPIKDINALSKHPECSGVYIAVPFGHRGSLVEDALSMKKTVLVEKPLHRNFAGVCELIKCAHHYDTYLYAGHLLRYNPEIARMVHFVRELEANQIESITLKRAGRGRPYSNQDVIMDFMIHDVSLAQSLIGPLCPELKTLEAKTDTDMAHQVEVTCRLDNGIELRILDDNKTDMAERSAAIGLKDKTLIFDEKTGQTILHYNDGVIKVAPLPDLANKAAGFPIDALGIMVHSVFGAQKDPAAYMAETALTEDAYKFTGKVRDYLEGNLVR